MSGHRQPLNVAVWPKYNLEAAREEEITIVVQVNGKVRTKLQVAADTEDQVLEQMAVTDERIVKILDNRTPKKIIIVQKKLVNIVL